MFDQFKILLAGLKADPMPTICAVLIGATVYLWLDSITLRNALIDCKTNAQTEIVQAQDKCAEKVATVQHTYQERLDSIAERELRKTDRQLKDLNAIIATLKKKKQ